MRLLFVVPCYNEERRLDVERFLALSEKMDLLFVNDGSKDGTINVLRTLENRGVGRITVLSLEKNSGKAEAVRRGLLAARDRTEYTHVGYTDADLATPPDELLRLARTAEQERAQVVMGARVARAGADIDRKIMRHYIGRAFATIASVVLRAKFYDTQCGAKIFRATKALDEAIREPFRSRWLFDVELLGRLLLGSHDARPVPENEFLEVPLVKWTDVAGSKVNARALMTVVVDLGIIASDLERRRKKKY